MAAMIDKQTSSSMRPGEFVAFVAALMAVNALGVDLMLPALADIGHQLAITTANHRQWIITVYMLGFGAGQLVYGPLADRFGRRPILLVTLAGFVAASIFAAGSQTFPALLGARALQGLMSASTRVLAVAIVRDRYSGRQMARTLSVAQMIFFLVPIMAPSLGQVLLAFGPWRFIFYALAAFAAVVLAWSTVRLRESLPVERRSPLSRASLGRAYRLTLTNRFSAGYAVAASFARVRALSSHASPSAMTIPFSGAMPRARAFEAQAATAPSTYGTSACQRTVSVREDSGGWPPRQRAIQSPISTPPSGGMRIPIQLR